MTSFGAEKFSDRSTTDLVASAMICGSTVALFMLSDSRFFHWFVIPVFACGIVIVADMLLWLRRGTHMLDPVGILGILGFHFFFIAPFLHVSLDYWPHGVAPPPDWREWLGWMASLNFLGLLVYRATRNMVLRRATGRQHVIQWQLAPGRFGLCAIGLLTISMLAQLYTYHQFGGVGGYILAYEVRDDNLLAGLGWLFTIAESFPILLAMCAVFFLRSKAISLQWPSLYLFILFFLILSIFFGGLRGSRSNTVWKLLWITGMFHIWVRPIARKHIIVFIIGFITFMYLYGFYKDRGVSGFHAALTEGPRILEQETSRGFEFVFLTDLARADMQALILYKLTDGQTDYELSYGRTYLAAMTSIIPRALWPERPPTKVKEGTEIQHGRDSYVPEGQYRFLSSRVYGLAGEAMLNFGPAAVPISFAALGIMVGAVSGLRFRVAGGDARLLLFPLLVILCVVALTGDSDNVVAFVVRYGLLPSLLILCGSSVIRH